jgi:biopolymer transport protein ExbD
MLEGSDSRIQLPTKPSGINLTPVIDIVFLLIIFFCVVCQFIEAENFAVAVPEDCEFAQEADDDAANMATVTLMRNEDGGYSFAVGAERVESDDYGVLVGRLAERIDARLEGLAEGARVVTLRVDKDICYEQAQFALAAIANSSATNIRLAAKAEDAPR